MSDESMERLKQRIEEKGHSLLSTYQEFQNKLNQIIPRISVLSEKHWKDEGFPTADEWMLKTRGLDWETCIKYPNDTARTLAQKQALKEQQQANNPPKKRGRPKGSKNKPKRPAKYKK